MYRNIQDVRPGDVILDGGNRTTVVKHEVNPAGCRFKVHVNDKDCYDGAADVRVQENHNNKELSNAEKDNYV